MYCALLQDSVWGLFVVLSRFVTFSITTVYLDWLLSSTKQNRTKTQTAACDRKQVAIQAQWTGRRIPHELKKTTLVPVCSPLSSPKRSAVYQTEHSYAQTQQLYFEMCLFR